ncbi:YciI family protein [Bacillus pseudomycoides]|uniref:YciI family protein n=1 Tax=Bacillus bingmayongensis TaxID=1150157 RepID=A0ABU5JZ09_9BACI|nr:YciI family protein [Bacillus pseudomycoides]
MNTQDLFLSLLHKQPSAKIFYGPGCMNDSKDKPKVPTNPGPDGGAPKLMLERDEYRGFTLMRPKPDPHPLPDPPPPEKLMLERNVYIGPTDTPPLYKPKKPPIPMMLERDGGKGLTLISEAGYEISPDKNRYIVTYREMTNMSENENLADQHVTYLRQLIEQGKLIMAGAYASGNQGMMVLSASSLEEAALIIEADPIFQTGYYTKADIDELL